ncbi:MAG: DNA-3-methyladenine glycosylase family protein [Methylohalobius sp. ZOD2]
MTSPIYWPLAQRHLSRQDPVMADLIQRYPEPLVRRGDSFQTLARAIVGQQISLRAADSVWLRLETAVGEVAPENILACPLESLRQAGLSRAKADYLQQVAGYYQAHRIDDAYWEGRVFDEVRRELLGIKGIGRWTVEMFAIFHLHEPDIFSPADIGLQKAVAGLYFDGAPMSKQTLDAFSHRWRPYRTVAAWYLWRHLDPVPVCY